MTVKPSSDHRSSLKNFLGHAALFGLQLGGAQAARSQGVKAEDLCVSHCSKEPAAPVKPPAYLRTSLQQPAINPAVNSSSPSHLLADKAGSFLPPNQALSALTSTHAPSSQLVNNETSLPIKRRLSAASSPTFAQPLWHGEDPRVSQYNGNYYSIFRVGNQRVLYKSTSLIDRGPGRVLPAGFPLFAPQFIGVLNGQTYNAWVAIDGNVWLNTAADPYDSIDQWQKVKSIPFSGYSIDFELFANPQPGPFAGQYYLTWAGAQSPSTGFGFESIYIAQLLSLRSDQPTLSTYDNLDSNTVAHYNFDWSDVIKEAPGAAIKGSSLSLVYSGNGAQTNSYGLGIAMLRPGLDPAIGSNWIDHNQGECSGDVANGPEFAQTAQVFGPGVARFTKSTDGQQDWMYYAAKSFSTFNRGAGTEGQQDNNEMYHRQVFAKPVGWRSVVCDGQPYAIPSFGVPVAPDQVMPLPSGDTGIIPGPRRIEAETMALSGFVMGPNIQNLERTNGDTDVVTHQGYAYSGTAKISYLDVMSADQPQAPQVSSLTWNNAPAAQTLVVSAAGLRAGSYDLLINSNFVMTLTLPATASWDTFVPSSFAVSVPSGAQLRLQYQLGKNSALDLDYIELYP